MTVHSAIYHIVHSLLPHYRHTLPLLQSKLLYIRIDQIDHISTLLPISITAFYLTIASYRTNSSQLMYLPFNTIPQGAARGESIAGDGGRAAETQTAYPLRAALRTHTRTLPATDGEKQSDFRCSNITTLSHSASDHVLPYPSTFFS